jgi:diadenosine tetraphosphate (Ap4A) HIT family hydrolase/protein-tyrosine-phosphatase
MQEQKSILFVCTGNVFRSLSAELCFKKYLSDSNKTDWKVGSAGTIADPGVVDPKVVATLGELGIEGFTHQQQKLTQEMLDEYDLVVGMAEDHIDFMKSEFGYKHAILFNELVSKEKTLEDISDVYPSHEPTREAAEEKLGNTVRYIHDNVPAVYKNATERLYLFSDFVEGKTTHRNGYPFITLHETPTSVAFMSLDIPFKEDGHILVIPKERHRSLSDIPDETLSDMLTSIKKIGNALGVEHGGYNVLLNNGLDAGQYIMHTHFHIIPRTAGDSISIETWQHPKVSLKDFVRFNAKLKAQIELS